MAFERELVYDPCAVVLLCAGLHLGERTEDGLGLLDLLLVVAEELERGLEDLTGLVEPAAVLLELAPFDPHARLGPDRNPALVYGAGPVVLIVALLHLDVGLPRLVVRLPLEPALEDLACAGDVLQHLLKVHVAVPQLVDAREQRDGAVVEVARVLDVAALELHLRVAHPEPHGARIDVQRAFVDGSGAVEFALRGLPRRVLLPFFKLQRAR